MLATSISSPHRHASPSVQPGSSKRSNIDIDPPNAEKRLCIYCNAKDRPSFDRRLNSRRWHDQRGERGSDTLKNSCRRCRGRAAWRAARPARGLPRLMGAAARSRCEGGCMAKPASRARPSRCTPCVAVRHNHLRIGWASVTATSDYASRDRRFNSEAVSLSNFERGSIGFHASLSSRAALYSASRCSRYLMKRPMTSTIGFRGWEPNQIKIYHGGNFTAWKRNPCFGSSAVFCFRFSVVAGKWFRSKNPGQHAAESHSSVVT